MREHDINNNRNNNRNNHIRYTIDYEDDISENQNSDDKIAEILRLLPISKIKKTKKLNKSNENKQTCVICLENYKIGDNISTLQCLHLFHRGCIEKWIREKLWCPICRYKISRNSLLYCNKLK